MTPRVLESSWQVLIQGFFIYFIHENFLEHPMDMERIAGYANWRVTTAHDYKHSAISQTGGVVSMARMVRERVRVQCCFCAALCPCT